MADNVAIYEKLGLFYIGQDVDKETQQPSEELTLLKNKNFTTHAAIIGMTGSGKTGLGIGLIEEAAIDNIPSIVIDPKGDMGNLCLTDPDFTPASFEPWIADEARAKGENVTSHAEKTAEMWKSGIESHHQNAARVRKFAQVEKTIYTPGSSAGVSVNVLSSLDAPPPQIFEESDSFTSYINSTVSSLLSLIGVEADPVESREYILLAQLITSAWLNNETVSLEDLIGRIISPPFKKIGVLALESFYPQTERFKFATRFNSIIASPTFKIWLEGDTLDIQRLLYDEDGKAKIAIFSIAHLSDEERMFFVTLLLNKYVAWMRRQSGSSALKTVLYMDEIYGFFPPTKNPPSKEPMLLLLKQARAYGIGVILSTQNPVDLDYKGLSNIGTWFIGRLQTTQDIERVIDGLGGQIGSSFNKKEIATLLANLKKRTFFLKSAHLDDIRLFSTRWVLSFLKGPLKRDEIAKLMESRKQQVQSKQDDPLEAEKTAAAVDGFEAYSGLEQSIPQFFEPDMSGKNFFSPSLKAAVALHFFNQTRGIDLQEHFCLNLDVHADDNSPDWEHARREEDATACLDNLPSIAPSESRYAAAPEYLLSDKQLKETTRDLKNWLYHNNRLDLYRCAKPKMESTPHETLGDFKVRVSDELNNLKESEIDTLKERYAKKEKVLLDRLERAAAQLEKEKSDSTSSLLNAGITVLGALFGKSRASIGRAGTRVFKERGDISRAEERVQKVETDLQELEEELEDKIDQLSEKFAIELADIEPFAIKLRKTDIQVDSIGVVWRIN